MRKESACEVTFVKEYGVGIAIRLTCYLAEDDIISSHSGKYEGGTDFGIGKVRKRKWDSYNIAFYRSAHASSSSFRSQSLERDASLMRRVSGTFL